jgi:hypothetical protein
MSESNKVIMQCHIAYSTRVPLLPRVNNNIVAGSGLLGSLIGFANRERGDRVFLQRHKRHSLIGSVAP